MKRVGLLILILACNLVFVRPLFASAVVISQMKAGNSSSPRLIELYNNTDSSVDVTNWCTYYVSAASNPANSKTSANERACFKTTQPTQRLVLPARSYVLVNANITGVIGDFTMTEGLGSGSSGHIFITDANKDIQDTIGWGTAQYPEQIAIANPSPYILERKQAASGTYLDTNNNAADFFSSTFRTSYQIGALQEVDDLCLNVDGYQSLVPDGYATDASNNCTLVQTDLCSNLDGMQTALPDGYQLDQGGSCSLIQTPDPDPIPIPTPTLTSSTLKITELLPNADGSDDDAEFVEIYNPNSEPVGLDGYTLYVGPNFESHYSFPSNLEIEPGQYLAFYNSAVHFTLVNSTSRAKLVAPAGNEVSETASYQDPGDGMSWSLFDDGWKYTEKATPDAANEYVITTDETGDTTSSDTSTLKPCRADQYRNPLTNRCKLKSSASGVLKACAADQIRNPETNRCKKISASTSSLTPCKAGQERNPETNRCRKIGADASTLKPCQPGYERNPDTNRCRKAVAKATNAVVEPAAINPINLNSRIITLLIAMAAAYGAYEYRTDVKNLINRLRNKRGDPRPPG